MPVSQEDRRIIVARLNKAYQEAKNRIFIFGDPLGFGERWLQRLLPSFPEILQNIPECAKKYKVEEIIEMLLNAYYKGELILP
jgi:hypothetical protein